MGRHRRLQHLHAVRLQELMNRIAGVLEVRQLPRAGRTTLATRGGESLRDAVIAECALLRSLGLRIDEAATVRASLHTVAATQAVRLFHQHHSIGTDKCRAPRSE